jgi:hypothetical protein
VATPGLFEQALFLQQIYNKTKNNQIRLKVCGTVLPDLARLPTVPFCSWKRAEAGSKDPAKRSTGADYPPERAFGRPQAGQMP